MPDLDALGSNLPAGESRAAAGIRAGCELAARIWISMNDWRRAQAWAERALRADATRPVSWIRLADTLVHGGPRGIAVDARLGLVGANVGDHERALTALHGALRFDGAAGPTLTRMSAIQQMSGHLEESHASAVAAIEATPDDGAAWYQLGRSIAAGAHAAGGFTGPQLQQLQCAWSTSLSLPRWVAQENARFHLLRNYLQFGQWEQAFALVGSTSADAHHEIDRLAESAWTGESGLDTTSLDWWFAAAWRLLSAGRHVDADQARRQMALTQVELLNDPAHPFGPEIEALRALSWLELEDVARRRIAALPHRDFVPADVLALDKLDTDLVLRSGQPGAASRWVRDRGAVANASAERAFRSMVEGRDVAIVGPADIRSGGGSVIDDHDVVIRTKYFESIPAGQSLHAGTRTDIAYYSDSSAARLLPDILRALDQRMLQLAVLRPTTYVPGRVTSDSVRTMPSEDLAQYRSTHFGLQRILYDVLRYSPRSVCIFNADFFTGDRLYADHYLLDVERHYDRAGLVRVLHTFGHDLGADFRFTRRLLDSGLVQADAPVRDVLELEPHHYLRTLDERAAQGRRS